MKFFLEEGIDSLDALRVAFQKQSPALENVKRKIYVGERHLLNDMKNDLLI